jgi:hypothetical protein
MPDHSIATLPFEPCHRQGHESSQKECIFCAQDGDLVGSLMLLLGGSWGSLWAKLNELGLLIGPTRLYASAVVELDHKRLIERVEATEAAIHGRLRDLQYIVTTMKSVS